MERVQFIEGLLYVYTVCLCTRPYVCNMCVHVYKIFGRSSSICWIDVEMFHLGQITHVNIFVFSAYFPSLPMIDKYFFISAHVNFQLVSAEVVDEDGWLKLCLHFETKNVCLKQFLHRQTIYKASLSLV